MFHWESLLGVLHCKKVVPWIFPQWFWVFVITPYSAGANCMLHWDSRCCFVIVTLLHTAIIQPSFCSYQLCGIRQRDSPLPSVVLGPCVQRRCPAFLSPCSLIWWAKGTHTTWSFVKSLFPFRKYTPKSDLKNPLRRWHLKNKCFQFRSHCWVGNPRHIQNNHLAHVLTKWILCVLNSTLITTCSKNLLSVLTLQFLCLVSSCKISTYL